MALSTDYDRLYREGWCSGLESGPTKRHQRRILKKIVRKLAPRTILEVGCGNGIYLDFFNKLFPAAELHGIDVSSEALKLARHKLEKAELTICDASKNILDRVFDMVLSLDVAEHIADDQSLIDNMFRMTEKGGHLLIMTLQGRMRNFEKGIGHLRNYQQGELAGKCVKAGYEIVKKTEWGFPFFSPLYRNFLDTGNMNACTFGSPGFLKKWVSRFLYLLFFLNSEGRGDSIFLLARKPPV